MLHVARRPRLDAIPDALAALAIAALLALLVLVLALPQPWSFTGPHHKAPPDRPVQQTSQPWV